MLFLLFDVAGSTYALPARRVVEVVPRVDLRPLAGMPRQIAGVMLHGGDLVPVVDLGLILGQGTCPSRLSTRIILVDVELPSGARGRMGLTAENVDRLHEHAAGDRRESPGAHGSSPLQPGVLRWDDVLAQEVDVDRLLAEDLRNDLFRSILGLSA